MSTNDVEEATTTGKRDRKQTSFFAVEAVKTPKKSTAGIAGEGKGIMLGDLDHFNEQIAKQRGDSDVVKNLHALLYGTQGKKTETKKNLRSFNGFPEGTDLEDKIAKLVEKKKIWTTTLLKTALGLVGLEKSGDRDALCHRLMNFLNNPDKSSRKRKVSAVVDTDETDEEGEKVVKKAKKEKSASSGKKEKKEVKISGYALFSKATREILKENEPELPFAEVSKRLGESWKALSEEAKLQWMDQAAEANKDANEKKEKKAKKDKKDKKKDKKEKKTAKKEKKDKKDKKDKKKKAEEVSDDENEEKEQVEDEGNNVEGSEHDEDANDDASASGSDEEEESGAEDDAFAGSDDDEAEL